MMAVIAVHATVAVSHDLNIRRWGESMRGWGQRSLEWAALLVLGWAPKWVALMVLGWEAQSSRSIECTLVCRG